MAQGIVLGQAEPVAPRGKHSSPSHGLLCFYPQITSLLFILMGIFSPVLAQR